MPVVLQLESDPTKLTSKACNTKSHCLSSLSWFRSPGMVPGRPEDLRVKLLRITFAGTALPRTSRKLGEDPSFLHLPEPGSWGHSLELILHQWQHGSNSGRDPEVSFFFVCTNPVSAFLNSGIWIRQKKKKMRAFLDLKSSLGNCVPQLLSLKRSFLLPHVLSNRENSNNNRSRYFASTHHVPGPGPCGLPQSPNLIPPSASGSRYYYPHFQKGKSWHNEVEYLALRHTGITLKSLTSNPGQTESKTCQSTTHW